MWCKNVGKTFFRFVTIHARLTDRQTDGRTELSRLDRALHYMQSHGKNYGILWYMAG